MVQSSHMPERKRRRRRRRPPGPEQPSRSHPRWAEQQRAGDLEWIGENVHVFWPAAQEAHEELGRGALLVDTTTLAVHDAGESHPFVYVTQEDIAEKGDEDAQRMVGQYDPSWELVVILLKPQERESVYRVGLPEWRINE
jgi:hypothetical protein